METKRRRLTVKTSDESSSLPDLPAVIWADAISKYCSHQDLRNCLAVNKYFRDEIPPLIKRLYLFNAQELDVNYATKFPNVEAAYIFSLTSLVRPNSDDGKINLCLDTARNVVAFLQCFPNLVFTHIGGYTPNHRDFQKIALDGTHNDLAYMQRMCVTQGHQDAFREMLQSLCNAFERESLDADRLTLSGIFDAPWSQKQLNCDSENRCQLCPRICQTFGLAFVASLRNRDSCVPNRERCRSVYRRDADFLKNSSILRALLRTHRLTSIRVPQPPIQTGPRSWVLATTTMVFQIQFEDEALEEMEFLDRECGCNASNVSPECVLECLSSMYNRSGCPLPDGWNPCTSRELFDRLSRIGFPLTESDFSIVVPQDTSREVSFESYWVLESDKNI